AVEAGFDALNPMEVKAGNNILEYAEKYGDKLAFVGGFDARILESGDKPLIRKTVTDFMDGMKSRNAKFIFGSDHSISTDVRLDDFKYAIQVYEELKNLK
ncbi:MAG: uroporphyrinogen decarboxylase family protein, partial [Lentisphaerota bacterium]